MQLRSELVVLFVRAILLDCLSSNKIFKIEPFKKFLQEQLNLSVPPGLLVYNRVYLMFA